MNTSTATIILHLSLIEGIGPATISKIIDCVGINNSIDLYTLTFNDYIGLGLSQKTAALLLAGLADKRLLDQEINLIEKNNVSWAHFFDSQYPELLKTIHIPPTVIYWQGKIPDQQTIAIVGSRDANDYGQMVIEQLIPGLVAHDFTIVSGGARGADTMAHQRTLDEGGKTVAVLGSGFLKPYPPSNKRLFAEIVENGGALMSTFPLLMDPLPENFPARNRVISGLSRGCIVIQAAAKSGARITADYALSQGREVFAVPGSINDYLSAGCHELIGQGAKLVSRAADVLVEFGISIPEQPKEEIAKKSQKNHWKQTPGTPAQMAIPIDPMEEIIIAACKNPSSIDELLEATGLPLIQMSKMLFELQLKGMITQNMAGLWEWQ